ncbi:acetylserotonin O-methyltransferase [Methylocystis heyeri]|nr:acetylserotonin O-methyltransferase [Methylocystis heyeri]
MDMKAEAARLEDRLLAWRDRLIADPGFQQWSLRNPLTRAIARRRGRAMLDLCAGFVYSQTLFACVRLRLFEILKEGPLTGEQLAQRLDLSVAAARRLLDAASSLGLAERRGSDRYGLGQLGAALIGNPPAMALIEHQQMLYEDLADPVALLRGSRKSRLADYWPYSASDRPSALGGEAVAAYSALMAASQPMVAEEALAVYPIRRHRRLMDVGGGEGVFLAQAAARAPGLELALFDLPAVTERARAHLDGLGLLARMEIFGGDFLRDPLPPGADVISLVRIVHDHDDDSALALLGNVRRALPPGGTLLIVEAVSGQKAVEPLDAYYGFYTLAMGRGEPRTFEEISELLRAAGFSGARLIETRMPVAASVIVSTAA